MLIVSGVCILACAALAAVLASGLLDYIVRLPSWFRVALLLAGLAAAAIGVRRWIVPATRFKPNLTEVALRIERSEEGRAAGLTGLLASGLELADQPETTEPTRGMAAHVIETAVSRFGAFKAANVLSPVRVRHSLLTLSVCIIAAAAIGLVAGVDLFAVGARRVLTPWVSVQWPKRTGVSDAMDQKVHALGTALPLRAAVTRTDRRAGQTRVAARFRVISDAGATELTRVLLTGQGRTIALTGDTASPASGELFERLIEPAALAPAAQARSAKPAELEYWFETDDDRSEPRRIKLVEPPSLVSASVNVNPPAYAASGAEAAAPNSSDFIRGATELGPGNDQRAVVGPVLAGSSVQLTITLNKPVPTPPSWSEDESGEAAQTRTEWLASVMPDVEWSPTLRASFDGPRWVLAWTADTSVRIPVRPVDQFGLKSPDEAAYSVDVVEDRAPAAAVIDPREDEPVLATAVVELTGEGRDDVGLSSLELSRQMARPAKGSIGAAPEPSGDITTLTSRASEPATSLGLQGTIAFALDLSTIEPAPKPGEEVWITTLATDNYDVNGVRHEAVRSAPRKLRIIKEEDLVEQIRAELSSVRRIAIRLDEEQAALKKAVDQRSVSAEDRGRQAGLTQRISTQSESVNRLSRRAERNKLSDEGLKGLLEDLEELLQGAARDSEQAAARMDAAAREQGQQAESEQTTKLEEPQAEQIAKAQESVRDQLERVAQALDRGEDAWLASRNLQRLIQQQRDLKARTERLGEQTMGKRPEDLTPQERAELAEAAEQQNRLSDQTRQTIDQLEQRSKQMQKTDPAQAEAMQKAAERGRQEQVPDKMQEASRNTERNQTSEANRQQEEAIESMEQMAQDMQEAQKDRDARLTRTLADLLQSLERLISDQTEHLTALAAANNQYKGLDTPLITLRQNTSDVAEKARADRATAKLAEPIDKAADSQAEAIKHLRAEPVDAEAVEKAENESLRLLRLARDEARKLQDEASKRDQDRKRDELRRVYREVLELQVGVHGDTEPFIGKPVERRDRARVRSIGERQEELRLQLDDLRKKTQELSDAKVFEFAHQRLDDTTGGAAKKLRAATPDKSVSRNQESALRILKSLVEALSDKSMNDDEFRDEAGGEQGGGGGGAGGQQPPLIPPLAELRLLRGMQQEAADVTRSLDESKEAEDVGRLGNYQDQLAERGRELIKLLEQQQGGGGPERPEQPAEPPAESPKRD
jgi:hypothetical protein